MTDTTISYELGTDGVGLLRDADEEIPLVAQTLGLLIGALEESPITAVEWSSTLAGQSADVRERVSVEAMNTTFLTMLTTRAGRLCALRTFSGQNDYRLYRDACE